ncbi:MAG: hypothetical protein Q9165_008507 [Trypethelium subeluteriae]
MTGKISSYKVAVLGDSYVGKSALFMFNRFEGSYEPTIEDTYSKKVQLGDHVCQLEVLDTSGEEGFSQLREQGIRASEGFILAYNVASPPSFDKIRELYKEIQRLKIDASHPPETIDAPPPIVLVGTQNDQKSERKISTPEGSKLAQEFGCQFMETSAKHSEDVKKVFYGLVHSLSQQRQAAQRVKDRRKGPEHQLGKDGHKGPEHQLGENQSSRITAKCVIL